jgi:hypothetical protein
MSDEYREGGCTTSRHMNAQHSVLMTHDLFTVVTNG